MIRCLLAVGLLFVLHAGSLQAQFLGRTADAWAGQLRNHADPKLRRSAGYALGKMGTGALPVVADMKIALSLEKDAKVREAIVFALAEISRLAPSTRTDGELEKIFLVAITDADAHIRRSAAFGLGCLSSQSAATLKALDNALGDKEPMVRQNAAWAVGQFGASAIPSLRKALRDPDSLVQRDAAGALLQVSDPDKVREVLKELLPLCRDKSSEVRRAALNVLVRIVDRTDTLAIPPLRDALELPDLENKRNAALALSNIGGEETAVALPVLLEAARNGDEELRLQAVIAVRNLRSSAAPAVPDLMEFLRQDKDPKMREYAALALGGIGKLSTPKVKPADKEKVERLEKEMVGLLADKIKDTGEVREIRVACSMALLRVGPVPAANAIAPTLLDVLADAQQDAKVRQRVLWALMVHQRNLRQIKGAKETFDRVLKEQRGPENTMVRYECAYMLGMVWQEEAPDATLDVLAEYLHDNTVKVYRKTETVVGGASAETKSGKAAIDEQTDGDGRVQATDALLAMGHGRYAGRAEIMKQLRILAADKKLYEPLRIKSAQLIQAAQQSN